jgi:hypothetical protein
MTVLDPFPRPKIHGFYDFSDALYLTKSHSFLGGKNLILELILLQENMWTDPGNI